MACWGKSGRYKTHTQMKQVLAGLTNFKCSVEKVSLNILLISWGSFTIKLLHGDGSDTVATEWHGFIDKEEYILK